MLVEPFSLANCGPYQKKRHIIFDMSDIFPDINLKYGHLYIYYNIINSSNVLALSVAKPQKNKNQK